MLCRISERLIMVSRSQALTQFLDSYRNLRKIYLPKRRSNLPPTDIELELTRAFVAFFHAELEGYFESACQAIIDETTSQFQSGTVTATALGLVMFTKMEHENSGDAIIESPKKRVRYLKARFIKAAKKHEDTVGQNHGISQGYLASLFSPLGLTNHSIDTGWVSEIQSLADLRGGFAHKSRLSIDGQPGISPSAAFNDARKIIYGVGGAAAGARISSLLDFDRWAQETCGQTTLSGLKSSSYWGIKHRLGWWLVRFIGNNQTIP